MRYLDAKHHGKQDNHEEMATPPPSQQLDTGVLTTVTSLEHGSTSFVRFHAEIWSEDVIQIRWQKPETIDSHSS